jgi:predicted DNA-binding transcriptional regulator YafY
MRADRLLSILMLVQTRGRMTAQALAKELEVSERKIHRGAAGNFPSNRPVRMYRVRIF